MKVPTKQERTRRGTTQRATGQAPSLTLTDLDQVRVLADPLRLRILEQLCVEARTTKQVAQRLGEKPTKLYHHVEALERVGLIRLVRTRQNRGTIEKYYLAVAREFRTDSRIFSPSDAGSEAKGDTLQAMISTVFASTADEMRGLVAQGQGRKGIEEKGILSYFEIRTDRKHGRRIQERLTRLIKSFNETPKGGGTLGRKRYRFTLAFYPIEPDV
jgi:DNA-binding transcriptional ArsR family regulator